VLRAADRFGNYGLVGVSILNPASSSPDVWEIDTLLMSCRGLGRGLEDTFLSAMAQAVERRRGRSLVAAYTPGPRNSQVQDFLKRIGFSEDGANSWHLSLSDVPHPPKYVALDLADQLA